MILVMLSVMARGFVRDRAGLILAFLLPPVVFLVFASVFGSGASGRLDVRAGLYQAATSVQSRRLVTALQQRLSAPIRVYATQDALREAVLDGDVDAGLDLSAHLITDPYPASVVMTSGRRASGEVLSAKVREAVASTLARDLARRDAERLGVFLGLRDDQKRRLATVFSGAGPMTFVAERTLGADDPLVVYYAGAVSILFLMFTAMQGAFSLIDDRRAGLRLRLGLAVGGLAPVLAGRMLWLTALGICQAAALFGVAAAIYHIPLFAALAPWSVTATTAAAASAGIALALAAACSTRAQAQTASTFVILILAAVGGSMAPRFLMPALLQRLGWLTPHAWVITAYQEILWRRIVSPVVFEAWVVLAAFAAVGFALALMLESRRRL